MSDNEIPVKVKGDADLSNIETVLARLKQRASGLKDEFQQLTRSIEALLRRRDEADSRHHRDGAPCAPGVPGAGADAD